MSVNWSLKQENTARIKLTLNTAKSIAIAMSDKKKASRAVMAASRDISQKGMMAIIKATKATKAAMGCSTKPFVKSGF